MHNSLFIRDLLRKTNSLPDRVARRDAHRAVAPDPAATPAAGDHRLRGAWRVSCEAPADVAALVVADAADFLRRMGVEVAARAEQRVEFALRGGSSAGGLGERDCRLVLDPPGGRLRVEAGGVSGLWAGTAWLEWEMRTRRGPFLPRATIERRAAWGVQISQGPWGGNYSVPDFDEPYLSDESFRLYAHHGVNSMMVYGDMLVYTRGQVFPELNHLDAEDHLRTLADAAKRAARYGVRFSYVVVGPKLRFDHPLFMRLPEARGGGVPIGGGGMTPGVPGESMHFLCSSHPEVHSFYEEFFTDLTRTVPELAGYILIVAGESYYHCKTWANRPHAINCPRCAPIELEELVAAQVDLARRGAEAGARAAAGPGASVRTPYTAAWAYHTWGWPRPDRREFVRKLPAGVAVYHQIDKDHLLPKDGYTKHVWDYSLDFNGVADSFRDTAGAARETGRDLFIKTETGTGVELVQFPYVPAMQYLADKWQAVRDQKPAGVQQSWLFFGMFGSRAEELGLWAAYAPDMPRDEFLRRLAVRDFGPGAVDHVMRSWAAMSESVKHLPCMMTVNYYTGPSHLGPAHPLVPRRGQEIPEVFHAYLFYLQEHEETFSRKALGDARSSMVMAQLPPTVANVGIYLHRPGVREAHYWDGVWGDAGDAPDGGWGLVADEYERAAEHALAAWNHLRDAAPHALTDADRRNLAEESLLTELVYRTHRACENTVRFLLARRGWEGGDERARGAMLDAAKNERENAAGAVHIYREAPWLDLAQRTDGYFPRCEEMIAQKLAWIDGLVAEITGPPSA